MLLVLIGKRNAAVGVLIVILIVIFGACSPTSLTPTLVLTSTVPQPTPTLIPPSPTLNSSPSIESKYSFEDELHGWMPQTFENSMACLQVSMSAENVKEGQFSLMLDMDLIGGDAQKSQGEAWVDMRNFPPVGEYLPLTPIDLRDHTITVWVFAPSGSMGENSRPNGFQIFVKDITWKSNYSSWTNVVENQWMQLSFTITASQAENGGYMEAGFDPSQIIAIGVKMGSGGGSTAVYKGPIYIDAVDW